MPPAFRDAGRQKYLPAILRIRGRQLRHVQQYREVTANHSLQEVTNAVREWLFPPDADEHGHGEKPDMVKFVKAE
jgi:hypothetical protein